MLGTSWARGTLASYLGGQINKDGESVNLQNIDDCVTFLAKIMPKKVNCCVPNCLNNFRNNPSLLYYRIPGNPTIRKEYAKLLRNNNLKLESQNT